MVRLLLNNELLTLWEKVPVRKTEITALGIRRTDHATPLYRQKLALTSPTSGVKSLSVPGLRGRILTRDNHNAFYRHLYWGLS
jgi:hypothetical protein